MDFISKIENFNEWLKEYLSYGCSQEFTPIFDNLYEASKLMEKAIKQGKDLKKV